MGAPVRDFHNFNVFFRDNKQYEVIAFTATQIPNIEGRVYPPQWQGALYPDGIPIHAEEELLDLICQQPHRPGWSLPIPTYPMSMSCHKASASIGGRADFVDGHQDNLACEQQAGGGGVRPPAPGGKSQNTRHVCDVLAEDGPQSGSVRHHAYGDLVKQAVATLCQPCRHGRARVYY